MHGGPDTAQISPETRGEGLRAVGRAPTSGQPPHGGPRVPKCQVPEAQDTALLLPVLVALLSVRGLSEGRGDVGAPVARGTARQTLRPTFRAQQTAMTTSTRFVPGLPACQGSPECLMFPPA